ncbi:MAG: alpha/beta hydrolase [Planctomycetota bacterium]|jgi:pimeloyl-ACP methyl ester carboxylesterase
MALRTIRHGPLVVDIHEPKGENRLTLLYSHGFGSVRNGEKVLHLGEVLAEHGATLIAPDLQGHGESEGEFGTITIERSIRDLMSCAELPEFADAPRRMLGGSSFGALTAMWTAVDHSGLVERLFLLAPAFEFVERHYETLSDEEKELWTGGVPLKVERDWFTVDLHPHIYHETVQRPVSELARRLDRPALIIHGKHDESVPLDVVVDFVGRCDAKELELLIVGDGDHRLTDHRELLGRELLRFANLD